MLRDFEGIIKKIKLLTGSDNRQLQRMKRMQILLNLIVRYLLFRYLVEIVVLYFAGLAGNAMRRRMTTSLVVDM